MASGDQQPTTIASILSPLSNISAIGVIFWIVIFEMPAARRDFREELRLVREHTTANVTELTRSVQALTEELRRRPIQ